MRQPELGNGEGLQSVNAFVIQVNRASGRFDHARHRAHGGGFASAVGANQGDHAAPWHFQRDAMQHLHFAVTGFQIVNS